MRNLGGRPLDFKKPVDLKEVMESYLNDTPVDEWTVTGLSLCVGSKQKLNDYENREGYGELVTEAKLLIENSYELSLRKAGGANNIFALKNFGWKDQTQQEINHTIQDLSDTMDKVDGTAGVIPSEDG